MNKTIRQSLTLLAVTLLPAAAFGEIGLHGWGPRVGLGDDPDQFVLGIHQDLGEVAPRVRLQPSFEAGFGDDHTVISATIPVHYRFETSSELQPYAGGGLRLAWVDRDKPRNRGRDDSEFDIGPVIVGGIEWSAAKRSDVFLELQLAGGDAHDAKVVVGWMFRAR